MVTKFFQPIINSEVANKLAPQAPAIQTSGWAEMTQEEIYAETERALDVAQRLTWGGFLLMLIGL